jgi:hypothetical protein
MRNFSGRVAEDAEVTCDIVEGDPQCHSDARERRITRILHVTGQNDALPVTPSRAAIGVPRLARSAANTMMSSHARSTSLNSPILRVRRKRIVRTGKSDRQQLD